MRRPIRDTSPEAERVMVDLGQRGATAGKLSTAFQTTRTAEPSWREKISYGLSDMGFNFYWANIMAFLMIFYTDVFGISAAATGSMLFVIKVFNAFSDPMVGAAADRTRTRFGKFRPYLVWMALPLAVAGVLTYSTPNLSPAGKLVWAYGTALLLMVCYSGGNIPTTRFQASCLVIRSNVPPSTGCASFLPSAAAWW